MRGVAIRVYGYKDSLPQVFVSRVPMIGEIVMISIVTATTPTT